MKKILVFLMRQKEGLHLNEARERISSALDCRSILISEGKKNGNYHLVLGVLCVNSSKSTILAKRVHILFNDCHCETRFLKGWGPICTYFSSRGEFQAFGCYSEKQIHAMAQQTRYHKKMGCGSDKNPWEGKNYNTYNKTSSKTWSKWFVIKRTALAAVVFQIIGYFFDKTIPYFEGGIVLFFPHLEKVLYRIINILGSREEEGSMEEPTPEESSKDLYGLVCVALFFGGTFLLIRLFEQI